MHSDKKTIDFFSEDTLDFVLQNIAPAGLRILEVGCGSGEFGLELKKSGAIVTALDTDEKAIELAKEKGLDARKENIISFNDGLFDAVIFTRSLHHIHELEEALEQTRTLLKPGGKILIEDFDFENVDYKTVKWYCDILFLLSEAGLTEDKIPYIDNPLQEWDKDHHYDPPLNAGAKMLKEVEKVFKNIEKYRLPYLFRSIGGSIKKETAGYNLVKKLRQIEKGLINDNLILPNGLRIVAEK